MTTSAHVTAFLSDSGARRRHVLAITNAKTVESGEEVLSKQSELRNLTPQAALVRTAAMFSFPSRKENREVGSRTLSRL